MAEAISDTAVPRDGATKLDQLQTFSSPSELASLMEWLKSQHDLTSLEMEHVASVLQKQPSEPIKIWKFKSAVLSCMRFSDYYRINTFSLNPSEMETLVELLMVNGSIDTKTLISWRATPRSFSHQIYEMMMRSCFQEVRFRKNYLVAYQETEPYKQSAKELAMEVRSLRPNDAEIVASFWGFAREGTVERIKYLIENRITRCIVNDKDEPVCWVLQQEFEESGMLHCLEQYRRHGYAAKIMKEFTKIYLELGLIARSFVAEENHTARKFHAKLKRLTVCGCDWIICVPFKSNL